MRKLHCLLVSMLLLIGQGLPVQSTMKVSGRITSPTSPTGGPIPIATSRMKGGKSTTGTRGDPDRAFTIGIFTRPARSLVSLGMRPGGAGVESSAMIIYLDIDSKLFNHKLCVTQC